MATSLEIMVVAGITILMAASEENETSGANTRLINRSTCSQYSGVQSCGQRNAESWTKGDTATCSLSITEKKRHSSSAEKNDKIISRVESKEIPKNFVSHKATSIRETRASRLRAASVALPSGGTLGSKKMFKSEIPGSQRYSLSAKKENPPSSNGGVTMNPIKERERDRDKSYKCKPHLNKSRHTEAAPIDCSSETESGERRSRRQSVKRNQVHEMVLTPTDYRDNRQTFSPRRKYSDLKMTGTQCGIVKNPSKTCSSPPITSITSAKRSIVQPNSSSLNDSEISRRVDALTVLTRATMERVERLTSTTSTSSVNHSTEDAIAVEKVSPRRSNVSKHAPISILKHKAADGESYNRQASSSDFSHASSPVTFSPSVMESASRKRHGILKKRSSLDESEILRRRSCSPDVSSDSAYSEFRPILKNQRRSSLDEIIKRDQSPDQQPASILKHKSFKEDDREVYGSSLGSLEPQSILKRKLVNSVRANSIGHHYITIASDIASASADSCVGASACFLSDSVEGSEVKPILKKKHGREELGGSGDASSLEPRPILKKKSSTELDEHEYDRPKKTILKSSRKNSYEEGGHEVESTSPKKLSALKSRAIEFENVRSILKQSSSGRHHDDANSLTTNLFLRKRAQSVGHARAPNGQDNAESIRALAKRRSLESSSPIDMLYAPTVARQYHAAERPNEISHAINSVGAIKESKLLYDGSSKTKRIYTSSMEEKSKTDSYMYFTKTNSHDRETIEVIARTSDEEEIATRRSEEEQQDTQAVCENYTARRSNSVSKMTQHFKALEEKARVTSAESDSQNRISRKSSHSQHYRKAPDSERFNTQPVTSQEVREAVLQNQRNAAAVAASSLNFAETLNDELEPSKLSLAERVRLFDRKIMTTETAITNIASREILLQRRRRPSARYKTQPVTSEEVEVASRISPLNVNDQFHTFVGGYSNECQKSLYSPSCATSQHDLPRGILKSSVSGYAYNLSQTKNQELQGMKLIRSVLKKESEESSEQLAILPGSSEYPRSILKSTPHPRPASQSASVEVSRCERGIEGQNSSGDIAKREQLDSFIVLPIITQHNLHCLCDTQIITSKLGSDTIRNEVAVPYKSAMSQREKMFSDDINSCRNEIFSNSTLEKRRHEQCDDSSLIIQVFGDDNDEKDADAEEEKAKAKEGNDDECAIVSSDNHEVHDVIVNEEKDVDIIARNSVSSLDKNQRTFCEERQKRQRGLPLMGLHNATQVIESIETSETSSISIADRLAALRHNGSTNWKRRIATSNSGVESCDESLYSEDNNMITRSSTLTDCIGKLESAAEGWRKRIVAPDASNFTVAGKMKVAVQSNDADSPFLTEVASNILNRKKKIPNSKLQRRIEIRKDKKSINVTASTPTSPCKDSSSVIRASFSEPVSDDSGEEYKTKHVVLPTVSVPKMDDETFTSFFSGVSLEKCETECLDLDETDFDIITPQSELLVQKRSIRAHRRRVTSRNPLKILAARTDLRSEYTEIRSSTTVNTVKNLSVEKLAKSSSFAVEALAGLASTEDFSAVTLRNVTETSVSTNKLQPYKDIMLLLIKGRRHVQARLVEPVVESINSGDNYILVTKSEIFNYIGKYSNIIEKTRAAEIVSCIQQQRDLGCQATQIIIIDEDKPICTKSQMEKFWTYLGAIRSNTINVSEAGPPDEDELYESAIIDTNMVYEMRNKQLVPYEKFWATLPKIEMLDKNKILVFDFGTEMYIWSGKGVTASEKKLATQLATEMWNEGYDYTECTICPINATRMIGNRNDDSCAANPLAKSAKSRPEWCLLAKLTQHVETILFREKFLDWPNITDAVKTRGRKDDARQIDGAVTVQLDDNDDIWLPNNTPVDLILEGCHLGRGTGCYDSELRKEYVVVTTSIMVWHIDEFSHTLLNGSSVGQFYSGDSYIIQWTYSVTITGRELSGLPSKHSAKGRDRSVYFIWQGRNASLNERGAAALLTVKLDSDQSPQIRVVQGHEPAAFLNLFSGRMVVHCGKKSEKKREKRRRLYICRGTLESETSLVEIPCSTRQLRSRGSFLLLDNENAKVYVWHGSNSLRHIKENVVRAARKLKESRPREAGLSNEDNVQICEIYEGLESEEFSNALGGINRKLYWSLEATQTQDHTPRLYHLSSSSKKFCATEILCPHRADLVTPFPFSQDDLYQASQPALFLLNDKDVIWIWQGWWPDSGTEDQSGSRTIRWQAERRAAMMIAIRYWRNTRKEQTNLLIYLVWAGLEPLQFINLFPQWTYRDDVAELNIEDGRNPGEILTVESELARLTQSTYPPAQLLQRPLPDGVDPTRLELYLSQQHFQELLGMNKEEFQMLPTWKQVNLKKEIGLF